MLLWAFFTSCLLTINLQKLLVAQSVLKQEELAPYRSWKPYVSTLICKHQKLKEQVKVSKCQKFADLILKTVTLVKFLKTENLTENLSEFCIGQAYNALPAMIPCKLPYILF